jgi:1-acyl-sn-glycerol-3-phosphate acyltransferase
MPLLPRLVLRLADLAAGIFYRRSTLGGEVPAAGPVLLVGNHPNGLVDPVFLAAAARRPVRFLGKAPLLRMPVLGGLLRAMRMLPVYRAADGYDTASNARTFDAVYDALAAGDAVAMFPEGTTHGCPRLEPLRTGAARMALGAEARAGWSLGVRVVPVGLAFRAKGRFRSRAATWIGAPIAFGDLAAAHARDERAAVRALTERIAAGLRAVTIEVDRWEDLPLLELAERISRPDAGRRVARIAALAAAAAALRARDPAALARLADDLATFGRRLERLGLGPDDLGRRYTVLGVLRFAAARLAPAVLATPLGALGLALWWPPYRVAAPLARLSRPDPETFATAVLLAALVVFPAWLGVLLAAAAWAGGLAGAAAALLLAPLLGLVGLAWWERRRQVQDDLTIFLRLALRGRLLRELAAQRDALAARIEALHAGGAAGEAARDSGAPR